MAKEVHDHDRMRREVVAGRAKPLSEIADRVLGLYPGRLLDAEIEEEHGRIVYELRILSENGRVHDVDVDATTGEVIDVHGNFGRGRKR